MKVDLNASVSVYEQQKPTTKNGTSSFKGILDDKTSTQGINESLLASLGLNHDEAKVLIELLEKLKEQPDGSELLLVLQSLLQTQPMQVKDLVSILSDQQVDYQSLLKNRSLVNGQETKLLNELKTLLNQIKNQNQVSQQSRSDYLLNLFKRNFSHLKTNAVPPSAVIRGANTVSPTAVMMDANPIAPSATIMDTNAVVPSASMIDANIVASSASMMDTNAISNSEGAGQALPMNKIQQFVLFVEENKGQTPYSQEKFIKDFQTILAKSQFNVTNGQTKLMIKLFPEHLGSLRIELIQKDHALIAKILTTTASAKDMLESQIQQLKHTFQAQNIPVEKIDISPQLGQNLEKPLYQEQNQNEQREQHKQHQNQKENDEPNHISFEEALLNFQV